MTVLHYKNCKLVCKCQMKATYELVPAVHEESENFTIFFVVISTRQLCLLK